MPLIKKVTKLPDIKADKPIDWQDSAFTQMTEAHFWVSIWALPAEVLEAIALWKRYLTIDWRDAQQYVEQGRPAQQWTNLPIGTILEVIGSKSFFNTHLTGRTFEVTKAAGYSLCLKYHVRPVGWNPWWDKYLGLFLPDWKVRIVSLPDEGKILESEAVTEPEYPVTTSVIAPHPDETPVQTIVRQQQIADSFEFV